MNRQTHRKRSQSSDRSRTRHKHKNKDKKRKQEKRRREESSHQHPSQKDRENYKSKHEQQQQAKEGQSQMVFEASAKEKRQEIVKQKPCWEPSGILLQFYNSREGVSLKFHEPPESRRPTDIWRIYIFKGQQVFQPVLLSNSCYLLGKDNRICDILCQNQSISRQHAVIQFRLTVKQLQDGSCLEQIKPYLMDLDSTNGTFLNNEKIDSSRYIQLLQRDVLRFGFSERQYVMVKEEGGTVKRGDQD